MSKSKVERKGEQIGLHINDLYVLRVVAGWFSGAYFGQGRAQKHIGRDKEPPVAELARKDNSYGEGYEQHVKRMRDKGFFKSEERGENVYIAGSRCEWIPTEKALSAIEHVYSHYVDHAMAASWATDAHSGPPIYRDGSELMPHRKGVLAAKEHFGDVTQVGGVYVYPRGGRENRADLWLARPKGQIIARVEVLSSHNNRESWVSKFDAWRDDSDPTIWVVENRRAMVQLINHFVREGKIELDNGTFGGEANNWSPKRVNARLQRSRKGRYDYHSHDAVTTIPSVLQGSLSDAHQLLSGNDII